MHRMAGLEPFDVIISDDGLAPAAAAAAAADGIRKRGIELMLPGGQLTT